MDDAVGGGEIRARALESSDISSNMTTTVFVDWEGHAVATAPMAKADGTLIDSFGQSAKTETAVYKQVHAAPSHASDRPANAPTRSVVCSL